MKKAIFLIILLIILNGCVITTQSENLIFKAAKDLLLTKEDIADYFDGAIVKEGALSKKEYEDFYVKGNLGLSPEILESLGYEHETYGLDIQDFKEGYSVQYESPVISDTNKYRQNDSIYNSVKIFNNIKGAKKHLNADKRIISVLRKNEVIFPINIGDEGIRINKVDSEILECQVEFRKANLVFSISYLSAKKISNSEITDKTENLGKIILEKFN